MDPNRRLRRLIGSIRIEDEPRIEKYIQDYLENPNFDINGKYNDETALSTAIKNGDFRTVVLLIKIGADVLARSGYYNKTPYEIATEYKQIFIREFLYKNGGNPKIPYGYSMSYGTDCSICLGTDGDFVILNNCNHIFHKDCIDTWANTSRTCPECRTKFFGRSRKRSKR